MRIQLLLVMMSTLLTSCKTYLDISKNSIATDYMTFKYQKNYNELDYFNKVNAARDKDVFYTTHFTINLPKDIVYWMKSGNTFFFEYDSKQVIYIYTAYKNEGKDSDTWELKNVDEGSELKYLEDYWKERRYNESLLDVRKKNRVTKLYTNGKYKILLYNIKQKNFFSFFDFIKTYKTKA